MIEAIATSGTPDAAQRRCYDCRHCKAAVGWWCKNAEAVAWRGTNLPGVRDCPFWAPMRQISDLGWWDRHFNFGDWIGIALRP